MTVIYETPRTIVRLFRPDDVDAALEYMADPEVACYTLWSPYDREQAEAEIKNLAEIIPGQIGKWDEFAIELKETGRVIGSVSLHIGDATSYQAELGWFLNRRYQGQGLAYEAVRGLLNYGIKLDVHRFFAIADVRNTKSVALMERLGMRREAYFRENLFLKGEWNDEYYYAILAREVAQNAAGMPEL